MAVKQLKVTLVRSPAGRGRRHMACVRGLGLRRLRDTVTLADTPATRGLVRKISYLLHCEEVV